MLTLWQWCTKLSIEAQAMTSSPKTSPVRPGLMRGSFVVATAMRVIVV
jgi:hypothetical protein